MNLNKKFDRLRRWGDEKFGASKTDSDENFKALEQEMDVRHKGVEKLHGSISTWIKMLAEKRTHPESKERSSAVGNVGITMNRHGQEFDTDSKFGQCLISFGLVNERLARAQDNFTSDATSAWIEPLDRSLVQMKEYQNSRKKLETRRLAYDTSLSKMQKSKKEDYRLEDELRGQKIKYEESMDEVYRRMQDISETESDLTGNLYSLLEAELNYHDRCREILLQLKRDWPAGVATSPTGNMARRPSVVRSRTSTLSRVPTTSTIDEDSALDQDLERPPVLPIRQSRTPSASSSPGHEAGGFNFTPSPTSGAIRTPLARTNISENITHRPSLSRTGTDTSISRVQLRPVKPRTAVDVFGDNVELLADDVSISSPERRSSGASSSDVLSRNTSWSTLDASTSSSKKAPPPPPPRRDSNASSITKKAPPPPPPMKRSTLSSSSIPGVASFS